VRVDRRYEFGVVPPRCELKQLRIAFDELVVVAPLEQMACVPMSPVERRA